MRVFICDDQRGALDALSDMIHDELDEAHIRMFESIEALQGALERCRGDVDVVFLDIVFSGQEEIESANRLHALYPEVPIVFITGHLRYAPEIFDANPLYLLSKPFRKDKLAHALQAVQAYAQVRARSKVTVRTREGLRTLDAADIEYLESKGRKITMYGSFGSIEYYGKLSETEEQLPGFFARCHQSYLINMDRTTLVTQNAVSMMSGKTIPISKRRSNKFRQAYLLYHSGQTPGENESTSSKTMKSGHNMQIRPVCRGAPVTDRPEYHR